MLPEASMEMTSMALDQNQNQFKGDENLRVQFGVFAQYNEQKSAEAGRPIFTDEVYITIIVPGQVDIVHRKAWRLDFERFPKQYSAFKNQQDQDLASGTPLRVLPWIQLSQVKELEYFNVRTVEQLANMNDSVSSKFMGAQALKQKAKDFLTAAKEVAPLTAMRAELDQRDSKIEVLERQVAALVKKLEEVAPEEAA
jgi:hypothetical protein